MSTGMPAGIWLTKFGTIVRDYFGHVPYHVGSSLSSKTWRDVDVRLILPDEEFAERFGGRDSSAETNPKLGAITLAFAALGSAMTGLPIDFQIQPQTWANEKYPGARSALIEVREPVGAPLEGGESHAYLSTGCLHGEHDYCAAMTGYQGEKRPAQCKFCDARCVCDCHTTPASAGEPKAQSTPDLQSGTEETR